eukprot:7777177-Alexandrium_andersonii.AAC.1
MAPAGPARRLPRRSMTPPSPEIELVFALPDGPVHDAVAESCAPLAVCRARSQLKAFTTAFTAWRAPTI